ncbi:hypothetical protein I8752_04755 [Nostocaceae cyanobacterium CENA369]|uniref:Uncharacterized protein n=1 Tax=Dendronalium phyllosphericum CENA369 TaxID=1725256 RepID=A0A8J7HY24_9NOST|nr:hypothetical protein [Dendronalium phyllosphericum]MBH8572354.1 hypothetical protein [Dendronalium phyllosphericum CENA369]
MNYWALICRVCLACSAFFILEGLMAQEARGEWVRSLYAGQSDWVKWNLSQGSYVLEASTLLNAGDVDIEFYDYTGQNLLFKGNKAGGEIIPFTVNQEGDFYIKYSMPVCINPWGACAVEINVKRVQ